jgi:hypothetical protein
MPGSKRKMLIKSIKVVRGGHGGRGPRQERDEVDEDLVSSDGDGKSVSASDEEVPKVLGVFHVSCW